MLKMMLKTRKTSEQWRSAEVSLLLQSPPEALSVQGRGKVVPSIQWPSVPRGPIEEDGFDATATLDENEWSQSSCDK